MSPIAIRFAVISAIQQYAPIDLGTVAVVAGCSRADALLALYQLRDAGYARVVQRGAGRAADDAWGWSKDGRRQASGFRDHTVSISD
jgi:hypothetical protein